MAERSERDPRRREPYLVRLPWRWLRRLDVARWLSAMAGIRGQQSRTQLDAFQPSGPELRFARALIGRHRNLWLWRCHQRRFCGDFVVVDMSEPRPAARRPLLLELKAGADGMRLALWPDTAGAGVQLGQGAEALEALRSTGVVGDAPAQVAVASGEAVCAWFAAGRPDVEGPEHGD